MPVLAIIKGAIAAGAVVFVLWLIDEIGDRREAKVWARINAAAAAKNVQIAAYNTAEEKLEAVAVAARSAAVAAARALPPDTACRATEAQAAKLTGIK